MKRVFLAVAALLMMGAPAFSQQGQKVDVAGLQNKIEKSDADIANPKKNLKAKTWLTRGDLMMNAQTAYTNQIFENMQNSMMALILGQPKTSESVKVGENQYTKNTYTGVVVYVDGNDLVRAIVVPEPIHADAIPQAVEAYGKAFELDAKTVKKTAPGLKTVTDELAKNASSAFTLRRYADASKFFEQAYEISMMPAAATAIDTLSAYNTGYTAYFAGDYKRCYDYLLKAEGLGFYQDGEIYNVMYNAYRSLYDGNKEELSKGKEMLMRGLERFPDNANIITCLTDLYLALGDSPEAVAPLVQEAIAKDPGNAMLWYGLGSIYKSLGKNQEALDAFKKVVEINPNNAAAYYYIGYLYIALGDAYAEVVNNMTWTNKETYDKEYQKVLDYYALSIEPFEKAHELTPTELAFVEYLKVVTFRLRDMSPEIQAKFEKYNELFKQMQQ
ncbi:MAG: tetratricopeptide repeat protein [Tidjanibacter sp.]|nr:tetratricopeptide repeat protein [Tidjanibacter sp.]